LCIYICVNECLWKLYHIFQMACVIAGTPIKNGTLQQSVENL
jgi:hypothetical protein